MLLLIALLFLFFLLVYTYVLYPYIVISLSKRSRRTIPEFSKSELPKVAILMSAYNEEKIIQQKINSVYKTTYPQHLLSCYIGSDYSTDKTDEILAEFQAMHDNFFFTPFKERSGKSNVINALLRQVSEDVEIVILTDANVLFTKDCIYEMVKKFKDSKVGQVGANIINYDVSTEDIGAEEELYIGRENRLKNAEGELWGCAMGAFGACYAIRKKLIPVIPENFLMEDFFISMHVIKEGYHALLNLDAKVLEDIPGTLSQEFKRKRRISAGNFQNFSFYVGHFIRNFWPEGFVFFSHKVLRWKGPFILISMILILAYGWTQMALFKWLVFLGIGAFLLVLIDGLFQRNKIYFRLIRGLRYFLLMNVALLLGFFDFLKGIKTNAWQPTIRK